MVDLTERVHIAPLGYEYERVVKPADEYRAEVLVLIRHCQHDKQVDKCIDDIKSDVDDFGWNCEVIVDECDIFDLYDAMGALTRCIYEYKDNQVYVNVATGSKITAIAGMIASMALGVEPYYVQAENYGEKTVAKEVVGINELPRYHLEPPQAQWIRILEFVDENGPVQKKAIIQYGEDQDLPFMAEREIQSDDGKYGPLSDVLDPLFARDWIEQSKMGRKRKITLTEDGRNNLKAFRYLLD